MAKKALICATIMSVATILLWTTSKQRIYAKNGVFFYGHFRSSAIRQFASVFNVPPTHAEIFSHTGPFTSLYTRELLTPGRFSVRARPFVGDHIHMAIGFQMHGVPRRFAEHDRSPIEEEPYEHKSELCQVPGTVAYTKMWPHAGVHTHCDGLIHVHPWSSPRTLRREGTDITLGLWFDQVGIRYYERPLTIEFSDGTKYTSNTTHAWRIAERKCFTDEHATIYHEQFDRIWLGHAYASYVVWFDHIASTTPPNEQQHIHSLRRVGAHGYDNQPYPHSCDGFQYDQI